MFKKVNLFVMIAFMMSLFSCMTVSPQRKKELDELSSISKLLILPVYSKKNIFSGIPKRFYPKDMSKNEVKKLQKKVYKAKKNISEITRKALSESEFIFNIVDGPSLASRDVEVVKEPTRFKLMFNTIDWDYNFEYILKHKTIKKLIDKYKVDGILFQVVSPEKRFTTFYLDNNKYVKLPTWVLKCRTYVLNKNGEVLHTRYDTTVSRLESFRSHGFMHYLIKRKFDNILNDWSCPVFPDNKLSYIF